MELKLNKCPLFNGIDEQEQAELFSRIHFQIKSYEKNQIVAHKGDTCDKLYILLKGSVRGEMLDQNGNALRIEDIEAQKPLAPAFIFGKENKFPVSIIAREETQIVGFDKTNLNKLFQRNERFLTNYLNAISNRTQFLTSKIQFLTLKSIKAKIANYLLDIAGDKLISFTLNQTQAELAELFGVSRPALARELSLLNKDGIIETKGKNIRILNKGALHQLI